MRRWNVEVLGWAALGLGAGMLGGALLGGIAGTVTMWVALAVPVVLAFRRGVPRGLLAFRAGDLLYGIVIGGLLRIVQGWLSGGAFPSYASLDGRLPPLWWATDLIAGALIAPVVEEFFFRGLLLIVVFTLVRRFAGRSAAGRDTAGIGLGGFTAIVVSAGLFVVTHQLVSPLALGDAVALSLLGVATGFLVVITGRIWPAVLVHLVFNLTGVGLTVVGTLLG